MLDEEEEKEEEDNEDAERGVAKEALQEENGIGAKTDELMFDNADDEREDKEDKEEMDAAGWAKRAAAEKEAADEEEEEEEEEEEKSVEREEQEEEREALLKAASREAGKLEALSILRRLQGEESEKEVEGTEPDRRIVQQSKKMMDSKQTQK
jgi:hypothetical protein